MPRALLPFPVARLTTGLARLIAVEATAHMPCMSASQPPAATAVLPPLPPPSRRPALRLLPHCRPGLPSRHASSMHLRFNDSDDEGAGPSGAAPAAAPAADGFAPPAAAAAAGHQGPFHCVSTVRTDFDAKDTCYVFELAHSPGSSLVAAALSNKRIKLFNFGCGAGARALLACLQCSCCCPVGLPQHMWRPLLGARPAVIPSCWSHSADAPHSCPAAARAGCPLWAT